MGTLADIGAKKIMLSDPGVEVSVVTNTHGACELRGIKYHDFEEGSGVDFRVPIGNSSFLIIDYNNGTVIARRQGQWYTFKSFYDAVDWIVSKTQIPYNNIVPQND